MAIFNSYVKLPEGMFFGTAIVVPGVFHRALPIPGWESRLSFGMGMGIIGTGRIALAMLVGGLEHGCYFSIKKMGCIGMSSFPLTNSIIFQVGFLTNNQNQANPGFSSMLTGSGFRVESMLTG